jgi:hypothetical protein
LKENKIELIKLVKSGEFQKYFLGENAEMSMIRLFLLKSILAAAVISGISETRHLVSYQTSYDIGLFCIDRELPLIHSSLAKVELLSEQGRS